MAAEIAAKTGVNPSSAAGGKYVPPSLRGGGDGKERRGETMNSRRQSKYYAPIEPCYPFISILFYLVCRSQ